MGVVPVETQVQLRRKRGLMPEKGGEDKAEAVARTIRFSVRLRDGQDRNP